MAFSNLYQSKYPFLITLGTTRIGTEGASYLKFSKWTNIKHIYLCRCFEYLAYNRIKDEGVSSVCSADWPNLI